MVGESEDLPAIVKYTERRCPAVAAQALLNFVQHKHALSENSTFSVRDYGNRNAARRPFHDGHGACTFLRNGLLISFALHINQAPIPSLKVHRTGIAVENAEAIHSKLVFGAARSSTAAAVGPRPGSILPKLLRRQCRRIRTAGARTTTGEYT